jgi:hypothetical protein
VVKILNIGLMGMEILNQAARFKKNGTFKGIFGC